MEKKLETIWKHKQASKNRVKLKKKKKEKTTYYYFRGNIFYIRKMHNVTYMKNI